MADLVARLYSSFLPKFVKGRLLDLGCGTVPFYGMYRNYVHEVICADWPNTLHPSPHLDLMCDLTRPLPFREGVFDSILLSDVLEHIPNPELLWAEMARVLRPGGVVVLNVPFFYWLHEMPYDFYRYTEFALRRFAENAGLEVVVFQPVGGAFEVMCDLFAKLAHGVPLLGATLSICIQAFAKALLRFPLMRDASIKSAKRIPLGYFLVARKP